VSESLARSITIEQLDRDPHPILARLRASEAASRVPALDGWLVTRYATALRVMRDPVTFTVDDPRFSTAQVVGPSMLSLDGDAHAHHRAPFVGPFRAREVVERFDGAAREEAARLIDGFATDGQAELRRAFAGPLAAAIVVRSLGLERDEVPAVLGWYDAIVSAVTEITAAAGNGAAGRAAFAQLSGRLKDVTHAGDEGSLLGAAAAAGGARLEDEQLVSNAAVLLFGGIETTEGMIANAVMHLLEEPARAHEVRATPALLEAAIEESLRLEPAAAVIDRYATADVELDGAAIGRGELVRISLAAANRDPAVFPDPDRFDLHRARRPHLAFAQGPHVCVGVHLARLEARVGIGALIEALPGLRVDPERPAVIRGLVFRKPPELRVLWDAR
jgi:cytochrome P450